MTTELILSHSLVIHLHPHHIFFFHPMFLCLLHVNVLDLDRSNALRLVRVGLRERSRSNHRGRISSRRRRSRERSNRAGRRSRRRNNTPRRRRSRSRRSVTNRRGNNSRRRARRRRRRRSRTQRRSISNLRHNPRRRLVSVQLEVVQVLSNVGAVGTYWVAGSAVRTENRGVAVETGEVVGAAGVLLQTRAVEDVVGLVGGVHDVAPEESGGD